MKAQQPNVHGRESIPLGSLTAALAQRVMGWGVGPDRFLTGSRGWMSRWRFQPTERIADALRLLERLAPQEYAIGAADGGGFWATVRVASTSGEARESSQARALTFAIARAIGLDPEGRQPPKPGVERR
jgi:hypothetical protein